MACECLSHGHQIRVCKSTVLFIFRAFLTVFNSQMLVTVVVAVVMVGVLHMK